MHGVGVKSKLWCGQSNPLCTDQGFRSKLYLDGKVQMIWHLHNMSTRYCTVQQRAFYLILFVDFGLMWGQISFWHYRALWSWGSKYYKSCWFSIFCSPGHHPEKLRDVISGRRGSALGHSTLKFRTIFEGGRGFTNLKVFATMSHNACLRIARTSFSWWPRTSDNPFYIKKINKTHALFQKSLGFLLIDPIIPSCPHDARDY